MVVQYLSLDADLDSNEHHHHCSILVGLLTWTVIEHHHHCSHPHMTSQSLPCLLPCSSPLSSLLATGTLFFICIILCRVSALRTCPFPSLRLLYVTILLFLLCLGGPAVWGHGGALVNPHTGCLGWHSSRLSQIRLLYTHGYMLLQVSHNYFFSACSLSFLSGFFHRSEVDQFGEVTHLIFPLTHHGVNSYLFFLALASNMSSSQPDDTHV